MTEVRVRTKDASLHVRLDGPRDGPPLMFSNSLGTTLEIWDDVVSLLPPGLRIIRYDSRGHGKSEAPPAPYSMGQLINDAETICDQFNVRDAVFVGLSVGGMVGQGLATKRLDLVRGLVLSNTAARIGTAALWHDRIAAIRRDGLSAHAEGILDRWFGKSFRHSCLSEIYKKMLIATPVEGYCGTCAAIAGTDFYTTSAALRLPTLGIAGSEDGATPADLVRETIELIPGAAFHLMRKCGHLPCVEDPEAYAERLSTFLRDIGHI